MNTQGTQIISKEVLEAASTPAFVRDAVARMQSGAFEEARTLLEQGLQSGRSVVALLALAESYWDDPDTRARDPKKSIDFLKEAIQLAPRDARPYALLGRYLLSKGLRDQALNFLDRAIQLAPNDASSRRLRDRATLQKKKQYTVVVNAADFTAQKQKKVQVTSAAEQHKKEATRFLAIDPKRAAEELEKAERGENDAIVEALSGLFATELLSADLSLLTDTARVKRRGGFLRSIFAFLVVVVLGVGLGATVERLVPPDAGPPEEQARQLLLRDTAPALTRAIEMAPNLESTPIAGYAALAHVLLFVEHGADESHIQSAEDALQAASAEARRTPEALYARVLLRDVPLANDDADLAQDLDTSRDGGANLSPFVSLALAESARQKGDVQGHREHLAAAGFHRDAPVRAMHVLARHHAAHGDLDVAQGLLDRIWRIAPSHTLGLITGLGVEVLQASSDEPPRPRERQIQPGDGGVSASDDEPEPPDRAASTPEAQSASRRSVGTIERRATALLDESQLEASEAAPLALMLAVVASAKGDAAQSAVMLQRAQEQSVVKAYPGLLSVLSEFMLLDLSDFTKAYDMLSDGHRIFPGEIRLLTDLTRARSVRGLSEAWIRRLRTNATRRVNDGVVELPLGRFVVQISKPYLPLHPRFDARFFPEDAIRDALDLPGLTPQAAERRLSVVANLKLAELALMEGDADKAENHVADAQDQAANNPEVHLALALIHSKNRDGTRARAAIQEALAVASDEPRVLLAATRLQFDGNDAAAARKSLNRLAEEGFTSPTAYALAAKVALRDRDLGQAKSLLAKGEALSRTDLGVLSTRINLEHEAGTVEAARDAAIQILRHAPERAARLGEYDWVSRTYLALGELREGKPDVAKREADAILQERPDATGAHLVVGEWHAAAGRVDDATVSFRTAATMPGTDAVREYAVRRLAEIGQPLQRAPPKQKNRRRR